MIKKQRKTSSDRLIISTNSNGVIISNTVLLPKKNVSVKLIKKNSEFSSFYKKNSKMIETKVNHIRKLEKDNHNLELKLRKISAKNVANMFNKIISNPDLKD